MTLSPLVVVGAAGTGRETLDIIEAINAQDEQFDLLGVIDDSPAEIQLRRLRDLGTPYLGAMESWLEFSTHATSFVVAIASPGVRRKLATKMQAAGHRPTSLIHPRAIVGSRVTLSPGAIVYGGVQISTNVVTGMHPILNANVCLGHDCILGDFVSVNPGATISGEVTIEDDVLVGGRATVLQGLTIGKGSTVGAGALATKNVKRNTTVKGIPAK